MKKAIGILAILAVVLMSVGCKQPETPTPEPTPFVDYDTEADTGNITMKAITGGSFERSGTDITVSDFYMGETEVTQAQWKAVMGSWPGSSPSSTCGEGNEYPAYYISWYDAVEFCNALSELEGLEKVYTIDKVNKDPNNTSTNDTQKWTVEADFSKNGYRLPTEAEWEYAAGGGATGRKTYAGTDKEADLGKYAWYSGNNGSLGNSDYGSKKVSTKQPNSLGLYDMSGNVFEWCWDWYDSYSDSAKPDTTGPDSGSNRVMRGGRWSSGANSCRVADRYYDDADSRFSYLGLRLVRSL